MSQKQADTRMIFFDARRAFSVVLIPCVLFATAIISLSQPQLPEPPLPVDPRPIGELLSDTEKASLAEAQGHGARKQVAIYLKLTDAHLQPAFNAISNTNTEP